MAESVWRARRSGRGIYYGWVMLLAVSGTEMISWGVLYYAFTVFLAPMHAALGWSSGELTGAFSLALVCSAGAAVPLGRWIDRRGTRGVMTAGSCGAALLVVAWANVRSLPLYYLIWAGIGVTMAA